ncbi:Shedu immune nuclease family protein [Sphingopyxis panaciterrae]
MIEIVPSRSRLVVRYQSEALGGNQWIWSRLRNKQKALVSKAFRFSPEDYSGDLEGLDRDDVAGHIFRFRLGLREGKYYRIPGRILGSKHDVLFQADGVKFARKLFAAERNVSIFRRLSELIPPGGEIVIGGPRTDAIPLTVFEGLLRRFPTSYELDRYAAARVSTILEGHIEPWKDVRRQYETYLDRHGAAIEVDPPAMPELEKSEFEKYRFIRETIAEWLTSAGDRRESEWQEMILNFLPLIFPKYVTILKEVPLNDVYSDPERTVRRRIDIALVDAGGYLDVIEVKKPFDNILITRGLYRDNSVPTRELSGTIMQAEKYLFHLQKWGSDGEKALTERYRSVLPIDLKIRIANPKALLILGRDRLPNGEPAFTPRERLDLEVIKRKYANMIDIITYDDLLRRLDNIMAALRVRIAEGDDESPSAPEDPELSGPAPAA